MNGYDHDDDDCDGFGGEPELIDSGTLAALTRAEIDVQIATAKQYPRSIKKFTTQVSEMACLDDDTAGDCMYALPRGGKTIEGPSARYAEIVASAWGNCKAGARVISEDDRFVVAQGVFHDLERNVSITYEVRRRITDKYGKRFNDDMIGVTSNAACSIALRNAVFKGVPKAFWKKGYDAARRTAIGTAETLVSKRQKMVAAFALMGVTEQMICDRLECAGVEDIGLDHIAILRGFYTAIKDEGASIEATFEAPRKPSASKPRDSKLNDLADNLPGVDQGTTTTPTGDDTEEGGTEGGSNDSGGHDGPTEDGDGTVADASGDDAVEDAADASESAESDHEASAETPPFDNGASEGGEADRLRIRDGEKPAEYCVRIKKGIHSAGGKTPLREIIVAIDAAVKEKSINEQQHAMLTMSIKSRLGELGEW